MITLKRKEFREYFQPSKILLGIIPDFNKNGFNIITLCFTMTCSYKPPMISFAVEKKNYSYELALSASEIVMAIPGKSLAKQTMDCGFYSGRDTDKFTICNFSKQEMPNIKTPGIREAIANIELKVVNRIITGDHVTIFCEVLGYHLNEDRTEENLLAVSKNSVGYQVLIKKGMHRIGIIDSTSTFSII